MTKPSPMRTRVRILSCRLVVQWIAGGREELARDTATYKAVYIGSKMNMT